MRVFDQDNKEIANASLDMNSIQYNKILTDGETVLIPYVNAEFLKAVSYLVYDVIMTNEPDWMLPDYNNSKLSFFIALNEGGFDVQLSVEAIPCQYTEEEKQILLDEASKGEGIGGLNDYDIWLNIFASSEAWHSKQDNYGENWVYDMELTEEEKMKLESLCMVH